MRHILASRKQQPVQEFQPGKKDLQAKNMVKVIPAKPKKDLNNFERMEFASKESEFGKDDGKYCQQKLI